MLKKNLFLLIVGYFFVLQFLIAGLLRSEPRFHILGLINLFAMLLISFLYKRFAREKEEKSDSLLMKERVSVHVSEEHISQEKESSEHASDHTEAPLSESNIEYIKTKINRVKKQPLVAGSARYRFAMFLLALIGFGGILYMFWETFDFFAVLIGALGMLIFLAVIFKAAKLWNKCLLFSGYILFFIALAGFGIFALFQGNDQPQLIKLKEEITLFVEGMQGKDQKPELLPQQASEDSDFLFEQTGEVLGMTLSGEQQLTGSLALTGEELLLPEAPETPELPLSAEELAKEVTMLEAIKQVFSDNEIPLSTAKNVKFKHVAMHNEAYPYMKTALEKKMIGSTTDPQMLVSCEVYMVMKGLAQNWTVPAGADVKAAYWNVAVAKDALKGCQKGARLTVANL